MLDLRFDDTEDFYPSLLTDKLRYEDLRDSQKIIISIQYNQIDLGKTKYGFDQPFENNEANLYFERMKDFSEHSVFEICDNADYKLHFNRTEVKGNIKRIFDSINPEISKANPLIFHFALDPDCKVKADRAANIRNPRIYFMVGCYGMIHILFFDPYHEINP